MSYENSGDGLQISSLKSPPSLRSIFLLMMQQQQPLLVCTFFTRGGKNIGYSILAADLKGANFRSQFHLACSFGTRFLGTPWPGEPWIGGKSSQMSHFSRIACHTAAFNMVDKRLQSALHMRIVRSEVKIREDLCNLFPCRLLSHTQYLPRFLLGHCLAGPTDIVDCFMGHTSFICIQQNNGAILRKKVIDPWIPRGGSRKLLGERGTCRYSREAIFLVPDGSWNEARLNEYMMGRCAGDCED